MGEVRQTVDLDVSRSLIGLEKLAGLAEKLDATLQELGSAQKGAFSGAEQAVKDFNKELANGTKIYQKIEANAKSFEAEQKRLKVVLDQLIKSQRQFIAEGRYDELQKNIAGVKARIKELGGAIDEAGDKASKETTKIQKFGAILAGVFAVGAVIEWGKQFVAAVFNVTSEFQKFEAVLTTSLGSNSAAARSMAMIQDFAAKTPFSVQELTNSYVRLASVGLRLTNKELTALGDLASSTALSFETITEAALDAMAGENERLKALNITAKRNGETTAFTFRGVTTEVKNTNDAIKDYLISLGQLEGVTGSMANISGTLAGQWSNLNDNLDNFFLTIGSQNSTVMAGFLSFLSQSVELLTQMASTPMQRAAKLASQGISEYAEQVESDLRRVADAALQSGKDVKQALEDESAAVEQTLNKLLASAKANAKQVKETAIFQKDVDAAYANVKLIEGELKAIEDARQAILADFAKKANQTEAERAAASAKAAEEAAKKAAALRKKTLSELHKELEDLEKQAAKARLEMLDKNSEAYIKAILDAELKQIDELSQSITDKNRMLGLSPELTTEQQEQINALSLAASKKYYDALTKLQNEERDKLLELQKNSDSKELAQLENKYADQIRAAREAGKEQIAVALETARELERAALLRAQAERNLNQGEEFDIAYAENVLPDNLSKIESEQLLQQRILDIQIEFAKKRLALVADSLTKEDRLQAMQLENLIARLTKQQEELLAKQDKFSIQKLFGFDDEEMAAFNQAVNYTLGQLQDFVAATVALKQREVSNLSRMIDEKGRELDREIHLNDQGFASNVETQREQYEQLKRQREQAQREQVKAQRTQILLDTALQASNLITASSQIFAVLSPMVPVGIPLAIGLIATMFSSFFAAKAKALQAASVPSFGKGGGMLLEGPSHAKGGMGLYDHNTGRKVAEYEGNEYLYAINKGSTSKHLELLQAINSDNEKAIVRYVLDDLLNGTGVMINPELPEKLQILQVESKAAQVRSNNDQYFSAMNRHLGTIAKNTVPGMTVTETEDFIIQKSGNRTRMIRK